MQVKNSYSERDELICCGKKYLVDAFRRSCLRKMAEEMIGCPHVKKSTGLIGLDSLLSRQSMGTPIMQGHPKGQHARGKIFHH